MKNIKNVLLWCSTLLLFEGIQGSCLSCLKGKKRGTTGQLTEVDQLQGNQATGMFVNPMAVSASSVTDNSSRDRAFATPRRDRDGKEELTAPVTLGRSSVLSTSASALKEGALATPRRDRDGKEELTAPVPLSRSSVSPISAQAWDSETYMVAPAATANSSLNNAHTYINDNNQPDDDHTYVYQEHVGQEPLYDTRDVSGSLDMYEEPQLLNTASTAPRPTWDPGIYDIDATTDDDLPDAIAASAFLDESSTDGLVDVDLDTNLFGTLDAPRTATITRKIVVQPRSFRPVDGSAPLTSDSVYEIPISADERELLDEILTVEDMEAMLEQAEEELIATLKQAYGQVLAPLNGEKSGKKQSRLEVLFAKKETLIKQLPNFLQPYLADPDLPLDGVLYYANVASYRQKMKNFEQNGVISNLEEAVKTLNRLVFFIRYNNQLLSSFENLLKVLNKVPKPSLQALENLATALELTIRAVQSQNKYIVYDETYRTRGKEFLKGAYDYLKAHVSDISSIVKDGLDAQEKLFVHGNDMRADVIKALLQKSPSTYIHIKTAVAQAASKYTAEQVKNPWNFIKLMKYVQKMQIKLARLRDDMLRDSVMTLLQKIKSGKMNESEQLKQLQTLLEAASDSQQATQAIQTAFPKLYKRLLR